MLKVQSVMFRKESVTAYIHFTFVQQNVIIGIIVYIINFAYGFMFWLYKQTHNQHKSQGPSIVFLKLLMYITVKKLRYYYGMCV